jgi:hypothetical protein
LVLLRDREFKVKGQKAAILEAVKLMLPAFVPYKDIALVMLTKDQLESLKHQVGVDIIGGVIEYSKPLIDHEVMSYARSMVMNHMKKARELNGNQVYGVGQAVSAKPPKMPKAFASINLDILPDYLKEYVKTLTQE